MTDVHHAAIPGIVNRRDFLTLAAATAILTMGGSVPPMHRTLPLQPRLPQLNQLPSATFLRKIFSRRAAPTDLAAKMPLQEKVGQLGIAQAAAPSIGLKAYPLDPPDATPAQRTSPIDFHEALHGLNIPEPSTSFPVPMALSHAWDPDLMHRVYTAISDEAWAAHKKYNGVLVFHSPPTLNLGQEPRWGRVQETLSEDPFLASALGMEMIRGMQGTDTNILRPFPVPSILSAIIPNTIGFMSPPIPICGASMNITAPLPCMHRSCGKFFCSRRLQRSVQRSLLRKHPVADGYFTQRLGISGIRSFRSSRRSSGIKTFHRYRGTFPQAAATALQAGIDVDGWYVLQQYTIPALEQNLITETDIDRALINYLTGLVLLGIFDGPNASPYSSIPEEVLDSPEHRALALETARRSLVLLKNQNNILPLDLSKLKTIAIIGPTAATCELGGYSGVPKVQISPLQG